MGFFSDLKEDLSQAVTELMPEEEAAIQEAAAEEAMPEVSLEEMLQNLDMDENAELITESSDNQLQEEMLDETPSEVQEEIPVAEMDAVAEPETKTVVETKGEDKPMETHATKIVADETSVITQAMVITGDMVTDGSIDVIGVINGNIDALGKLNVTGHINGNSKAAEIYAEGAKINGEVVSEGAVKIGASTVIIGNITATSAAIAGAVKGDINVHGPVILDASAIVMGNIRSKSVQINNGAVIEGMCSQCYADVSPTSFFDDYKPEVKKARK